MSDSCPSCGGIHKGGIDCADHLETSISGDLLPPEDNPVPPLYIPASDADPGVCHDVTVTFSEPEPRCLPVKFGRCPRCGYHARMLP